mmetsp:Transcript_3075/g.6013  ORF Transcript_3075/g.6013 Transcript_3075/m.6013 type:complete len:197 (-) Transcript_3075:40-630(-)
MLGSTSKEKEAVRAFIGQFLPEGAVGDVAYKKKVASKVLVLENVIRTPSFAKVNQRRRMRQAARVQQAGTKEIKTRKLNEIPKDAQKYSLYLPLHEQWCSYAKSVMKNKAAGRKRDELALQLDMTGSLVEVVRCRDPSMVGLRGIVVRDGKNAFTVITEENQLKTIIKRLCTISYTIGELQIICQSHAIRTKSSRS